MSKITDEVAAEVAATVRASSSIFDRATAEDVKEVVEWGSVPESIISEEYDEALTEAILEALDARGIAV